MSDRFQELYRLKPNLYLVGAPVIIEAGVLSKDNYDGRIIVQLKMQNISDGCIVSVRVSIEAYETNGDALTGVERKDYLDLNVEAGDSFGARTPIYLPEKNTRKFSAAVVEVVFVNGTIWREQYREWNPLESSLPLGEYFNDIEIEKQIHIELGDDCKYVPKKEKGIIFCTCGSIRQESVDICYQCNRRYAEIVQILRDEDLLVRKDARVESERIENERKQQEAIRAAEERNERRGKRRKRLRRFLVVFGINAIVLSAMFFPLKDKWIGYFEAMATYNEGNFSKASLRFESLDGFLDSSEKALESRYKYAEELYGRESYVLSVSIWNDLGDYSDSRARARSTAYERAEKLYESENYNMASKIWEELDDYQDSAERSLQAKQKIVEKRYNEILSINEKGTALKTISECLKFIEEYGEYKEIKDILLNAEYDYVDGLIGGTPRAYEYLRDLIEADYPGAQEVYDRLFPE